jgi:tetratricopeptide (TPR) repeat protein
MSSARSVLRRLSLPAVALPILVVALVGWGVVVRAWLRDLPAKRHLERGMEFARQGLGPEAEREWKAALRKKRDSWQAYQLLSGYYVSSRRWPQALDALRKLRELRPDEPHVTCQIASVLLSAGDEVGAYREAEAELKKAPDCVPALAVAAVMLSQVGEEQRRLAYLRRLAKLEPDDAGIQFMLADALTDGFAYAEARGILERVLAMEPKHAEALTLLGVGWLNDRAAPDHLAKAESFLTRSLAENPLNGMARLTLGRVYLEQRQPEKAIMQLEEAERIIPNSFRVPFELARAYEMAKQPKPAAAARARFAALRQLASDETTLQKRCATHPDSFEDHLKMGRLQVRKGDYRKAMYYLSRARDLRPEHPELAAALRSLNDQSGLPARVEAVKARVTAAGQAGVGSEGAR